MYNIISALLWELGCKRVGLFSISLMKCFQHQKKKCWNQYVFICFAQSHSALRNKIIVRWLNPSRGQHWLNSGAELLWNMIDSFG